ncbi:unnamed protein product [Polarella glacialis]|uniref:Uncharacterized protein n=1 Tax=Polarella glacialis TaxID=89957 RepID=A0A813L1C9_POLGL|nr:unnamed protein product [Polarella glacialis]
MQQLHAQLAIRGGSSSGAEISVFQFVPYFLQDFVKLRKVSLASRIATASRVIYLSTDTITLGDIGSLNALNLNGMAVATVKSCSLRLRNIIDFDKLEILKLRDKHLRPDDCIANNALMVIDLVKWKMQNISGKMLDWHNHSNQQSQEDELWTGGDIVLPAFLLALRGNFLDLKIDWLCTGLGNEYSSAAESKALRELGFDHSHAVQLNVTTSDRGEFRPGLHACSSKSKLLHYRGIYTPWNEYLAPQFHPLCAMPEGVRPPSSAGWSREGDPDTKQVTCDDLTFIHCSSIWRAYLSQEADCGLKDFDKEWRPHTARVAQLVKAKEKELRKEKEWKEIAMGKVREIASRIADVLRKPGSIPISEESQDVAFAP